MGRWTSVDPKEEFDDSYRYCINPVNQIDPDGKGSWWVSGLGGFANAGANITAQSISSDKIDWGEAGIAFGIGYVQTEIMQNVPLVNNPYGLAALGGVMNVAQGAITAQYQQKPYTAENMATDATSGGIAGLIAGPASSSVARMLPSSRVSLASQKLMKAINTDTETKSAFLSTIRTFFACIFSNNRDISKESK